MFIANILLPPHLRFKLNSVIHPSTAVLAAAVLSVIVCCNARAQHVHIQTNSATSSAQAVVHGSAHPELISDQEAITVFGISIMEPPTAGEAEKH